MRYTSKGALFVIAQVILFVLFFFDWQILDLQLGNVVHSAGVIFFNIGILIIIIAFIQLNKNLSPFPTPKEGSQLISSGLYSLIRHPIYTGILVTFFGNSLMNESLSKFLITILLFVLFYFKSKYEEQLLIKAHEDYEEYMKKTDKFFPGVI